LRVFHNFGFDRFRVATGAGVTISNVVFSDGDADAGNDWSNVLAASGVDWTAPVNATPPANTPAVRNPLNWGTLFRFSFVADSAPVPASVDLHIAQAGGAGDAASLSTSVLGPGAVAVDLIFADGFDAPAKR
jgi:hypothetical protein